MTASVIFRAPFDALEIRSGGDGRTIVGRAVPFDRWTRIRDDEGEYEERFLHGAFSRTVEQRASKIPLRAKHDNVALPLGPIEEFEERTDGLWIAGRVSRRPWGRNPRARQRPGPERPVGRVLTGPPRVDRPPHEAHAHRVPVARSVALRTRRVCRRSRDPGPFVRAGARAARSLPAASLAADPTCTGAVNVRTD